MRKLSTVLIASCALVATASAAGNPSVRLIRLSPATVSGAGFIARETVTLTASDATQRLTTTVHTNVRGAFIARFPGSLAAGNCLPFALSARGSRGDQAVWRSAPVMCGAQP